MSRTVKKNILSLSFSVNRLYRRISTAKPSNLIIPIAAIAVAVFLFGGGLYNIVTRPPPAAYLETRGFLFLYPRLSEQFVSDTIVATMLYSLGIAGLLTIYQSTKHVYKPRQAYMMLLIGMTLLFLAYVVLEAAIQAKIAG